MNNTIKELERLKKDCEFEMERDGIDEIIKEIQKGTKHKYLYALIQYFGLESTTWKKVQKIMDL